MAFYEACINMFVETLYFAVNIALLMFIVSNCLMLTVGFYQYLFLSKAII